ncbi:hypothetical protein AQI88_15670 [Streptomyces cellostaticus]|uniref:Uncharacterized protein n=1 Tax=Streptomyces cellostaticus TaxID=67285 RepID=A0A101NMB3_9ACTN|nr:hypothetical protein [Streptomyces cellostaticus]KUM95522.1 hypothetical protein AQI88_15670 [Streptomyces cellostaticus]GHI09907.1 hypothetical protein Scel_82280 [Streptomyces cellostaticus]
MPAVTAGNPFEAVELTAKVRGRGLAPNAAGAHLLRDLAAAVAGLGPEETANALRDARILTGTVTAAGTLKFVHPLIATAVHRAIPTSVRVALHGRAAWCVINEGQGPPPAAARHLLEDPPRRRSLGRAATACRRR